MLSRLIICIKAWGAGIGVMALPLLFLRPICVVGNNIWQIPVLLFSILFPALLIFDFLSRKYLRHSTYRRILVLTVLLVLSELEFYSLPFRINQFQIEFTFVPVLLLMFFTILAALLLVQIMKQKNNLVIIQKEI